MMMPGRVRPGVSHGDAAAGAEPESRVAVLPAISSVYRDASRGRHHRVSESATGTPPPGGPLAPGPARLLVARVQA